MKQHRKRILSFILLVSILFTFSASPIFAADSVAVNASGQSQSPHVAMPWASEYPNAPGEILVKLKNPAAFEKINAMMGGTIIEKGFAPGVCRVKLPAGSDLFSSLFRYGADDSVEYAEPNYLRKYSFVPNDPSLSKQWALDKATFKAAWDISRGSPSVIVAVVDSGVDVNHPDLRDKIVSPYNVITSSTDPAQVKDDVGHGTHVAGIAAASLNNGTGVAGTGGDVKIMPVKVSSGESIYDDNVAKGIYWAVDHGARVINMSLGGPDASTTLTNAVKYAVSKNVVVVAAAGNDNSSRPNYPAALDGVISVAATTDTDSKASFSNYGSYIDVAAPGQSIYSTTPTAGSSNFSPNYSYASGTSMASPNVAGLAALVVSANPALSGAQVQDIILKNAKDLGAAGRDNYYGWGRIDAYRAVSAAASANPNPTPDPTPDPTPTPDPAPGVTGTMAINGGAAATNSISATISMTVSGTASTSKMRFSKDNVTWTAWETFATSKSWTLDPVDGTKKVYAQFSTAAGQLSPVYSDTIILDRAAPSVKSISLPEYSTNVSKTRTFKVSWSAADGVSSSGIASYTVEYRASNSTVWTAWKTNYNGTYANFTGIPGYSYYFRARAIDNAGNAGILTTATYRTVVPYDANAMINSKTGFTGTYSNSTSNNYLGSLMYSTVANDQVTYRFTGNKFALIGFKGTGRSKAKIYVDGVYVTTIDTYSATSVYRAVLFSKSWTTSGVHTVKVVNLGTAGRTRLDLDAVAVGR